MAEANNVPKIYYLQLLRSEWPNDLADFSIGSASAQAAAGTGWNAIQDSSSANYLEPPDENVLYQCFYGITPSYARIYRQFPASVDRGSLRGTRTVGGAVGYIDGSSSPYRAPSAMTEFHTVKELNPNFYGYHPYGRPATITIRLYFYIAKYQVRNISAIIRELVPDPADQAQLPVYTIGGIQLVNAPDWLRRSGGGVSSANSLIGPRASA